MENSSAEPVEKKRIPVKPCDKSRAAALASSMKIDPLVSQLLVSRGIADEISAVDFLYPRLSRMHSPFLIQDMEPAVSRLKRAVKNGETVAIFSDSDMDGLTSLTIVYSLLEGASLQPIYSFPTGDDTYGLTRSVIDFFAARGATLLITLDCGIRDIEEIAYAASLGIETIVCDHHEQGENLPDALVVDQKRNGSVYPFRDLAGAGVALKLCHALLASYLPMYMKQFCLITGCRDGLDIRFIRNGIRMFQQKTEMPDEALLNEIRAAHSVLVYMISEQQAAELSGAGISIELFDHHLLRSGFEPGRTSPEDIKSALGLPPHIVCDSADCAEETFFMLSFIRPKKIAAYLKKWLPFAAIGTVADIMPALGENRIIIAHGLASAGETGIPAMDILSQKFSPVTTKIISWQIAPLLNTPGRVGKTELTADFFLAKAEADALLVLKEISSLNEERKDLVKERIDRFTREIDEGLHSETKNFTYIRTDAVTDGFTGLIAGRIADKTGKPAIVVSSAGERDILKGSGRSPNGIDFLCFAEPHAPLFVRFGGHASAFGFSAHARDVDDIMRTIDRSMEQVVFEIKEKNADLEIMDIGEITEKTIELLSRCEPWGYGNEPPLFLSRGVPVLRVESFGTDGRHGKFLCGGRSTAAIGWSMASAMKEYDVTYGADMLYTAEYDSYTRRVRFVIDTLL